MKLKPIFLFSCSLFLFFLSIANPLLVVAIMVKDEEAVIQETLEPFLKAQAGNNIAFLVYDTGTQSWSPTMAKAQELFERYPGVAYKIIQEPFIDFSTSRNKALDLVEKYYANSPFVLMLDAEWYINDVPGLLAYCQKEKANEQFGPYFIRIIDQTLDFFAPRLIRQSLHSRFKGVVHEALIVYANQLEYTRVPQTIYFRYNPTRKGREKTAARYKRDLELLLNAYKKDPNDTHTTFYLAQTYECLNDWENAYKFYAIRAGQGGWQEDQFLAAYRKANAAYNCMASKKFAWQECKQFYLDAYAMRPTRIEPLIRIAQHYLQEKNFALAYLYAKNTLDMPYPAKDNSFVEKSLYDYARYMIVGVAAWYTGFYDVGESALRAALQIRPEDTQLKETLAFYINRNNQNSNGLAIAS